MAGGMIGANPPELRALGGVFAGHGEAAGSAGRRIADEVAGVDWEGPDAAAFIADVHAALCPMLADLAAELAAIRGELDAQADAQDAASEAKGGALAPGGPGLPSTGGGGGAPAPAFGGGGAGPRAMMIPPPTWLIDWLFGDGKGEPKKPSLEDIQKRYRVNSDVMLSPDQVKKLGGPDLGKAIPLSEALELAGIKLAGKEGRLTEIMDEAYEMGNGPGSLDGHSDAMRHAYLHAMMAQEFGEDKAARMGVAHEMHDQNYAESEAMDLYNNEVGRKIAAEHPGATREQLQQYVREAADRGELLVIGPDGRLAWSNEVAPGETGISKGEDRNQYRPRVL